MSNWSTQGKFTREGHGDPERCPETKTVEGEEVRCLAEAGHDGNHKWTES